ncbi:unnamed protein product [Alopecurus aequalis]
MEKTVLSVGKVVLGGAVEYAQSAVPQEVALQLGVRRDQAFVRDELEMMQAFLMAAHDERHVDGGDRVVRAWVKQVRDVAYDAEDSLQDFAARLRKPSWWRPWRIPRRLMYRRRVGKRMKELRAKVEDVSQRNVRYHLIRGPRSKPAAVVQSKSASGADAMMLGMDQASRRLAKAEVDLAALISKEEDGDLKGDASFQSSRIFRSLVRQFNTNVLGVDALLQPEKTGHDLAQEFKGHVYEKRYLVVLTDMATVEEWDQIKECFTNNSKKGSRIIVSTGQVEVASLCAGHHSIVTELKQKFVDQTIYAFHDKCSQDGTNPKKAMSSSDATTVGTHKSPMSTGEIQEDESVDAGGHSMVGKNHITRIGTMESILDESHIIGREKEKTDIIRLVSNEVGQQCHVISVWGMGGIGKTTLVKDIYRRQELSDKFDKRAFATIMRPVIIEKLLEDLVKQLEEVDHHENKNMRSKKEPATLEANKLKLAKILQRKRCLIVLDDVSSTAEWNKVQEFSGGMEHTTRIIVTTREYDIAKHCSEKQENIYELKFLGDNDARVLLAKKVFKENVDFYGKYRELAEQAKHVLKKCKGLPLAIVAIGGFMANQPKTLVEWRKLNEHISAELEMNPQLKPIMTVLIKSYDGLPYHLKCCFLYLSIFPEDFIVSWRRLVRRWTAEGYSKGLRDKSADDIADSYFIDLIRRGMIMPYKQSVHSRKEIDSCQVHDLMREISISMATDENLVFRLEDGHKLNRQATVRHLAIESSSVIDKDEFESTVDLSRVRSLTVFGEWEPFFLSDKMKLLRVLDLEDTSDSGGVMVPRGIRVLQALHTLRDVHLVGTHAAVEIGQLTGLRKLGVVGINEKNGPKFRLAISSLSRLESLSVQSAGELGLSGCLDSLSSPPERLQSLKLYGNLVKLPEWVQKLENLVKLRLGWTKLSGLDSAMQVLGNLPSLTVLRLQESAFHGKQLHFQSEAFKSLLVLELHSLLDIKSVKFEQGTMPKLEHLQVQGELCDYEISFDGLESLPSLKEVRLGIYFAPADMSKSMPHNEEQIKEIIAELKRQGDKFSEHFRIQLSGNPNKPILKVR